jgi:hypothetical protein
MENRVVRLGFGNVELAAGDHLCGFYQGRRERDKIVAGFLSEGLRSGNKCICVLDDGSPDQISAMLGDEQASYLGTGQLEIYSPETSYLRDGSFWKEDMRGFWEERIGGAFAEFSFARAVGEMSWALRQVPGVENLIVYEAEQNEFRHRYPQILLCLYDLDQFSGDIIIDVLKTHPKVLLDDMVIENPYYVPPDEFLALKR